MVKLANDLERAKQKEAQQLAAAREKVFAPHEYAYGGDEGAQAGASGAKLGFVDDSSSRKKPRIQHMTTQARLTLPDEHGERTIKEANAATTRVHLQRAPNPTNVIWMNMGISFGSRCGRVFMVYLISILILLASFIGVFFAKSYIQGQSFGTDVDCSSLDANSTKYDAARQWLLYEESLRSADHVLSGQNQSTLILPGSPNLLRCYCNNASTGLFASVDSIQESFKEELEAAGLELGITVGDIVETGERI